MQIVVYGIIWLFSHATSNWPTRVRRWMKRYTISWTSAQLARTSHGLIVRPVWRLRLFGGKRMWSMHQSYPPWR